ncbi:hypothetical protein Ciccas_001322 [Cichlidogyrus casuarinus]|uniref:Short coiled-coil protein n=1 Tax=Cichlidogyrus casuarinus TaxID=1844966 RepID=A0ABD2QKE6_9PLAT
MKSAHSSTDVASQNGNQNANCKPMCNSYTSIDQNERESEVEKEEKHRLISQILELQHTLEDLSTRVDTVKKENYKLKAENQILGQYIENLMNSSSIFQTTSPMTRRKSRSGHSSAFELSPNKASN